MPHLHLYSKLLWLTLMLTCTPLLGQIDAGAELYASRGLELARTAQLDKAEVELRRAVELSPEQADLAAVLGLKGNLPESVTYFQRAVQQEPESLRFRKQLAAVQWQIGRLQDSEMNLN